MKVSCIHADICKVRPRCSAAREQEHQQYHVPVNRWFDCSADRGKWVEVKKPVIDLTEEL